jgi:hypothetical protein
LSSVGEGRQLASLPLLATRVAKLRCLCHRHFSAVCHIGIPPPTAKFALRNCACAASLGAGCPSVRARRREGRRRKRAPIVATKRSLPHVARWCRSWPPRCRCCW